jgi:hypothetical protein
MLLSSIFAVAIGLLILWIVLSFATIQIQEWINTRLGKRARIIEDAIHEMLANPNLKSQFYEHPLIRGLTVRQRARSYYLPWFERYLIIRGFTRRKRILPSYVPAESFASALFDIVLTAGTESSLIQQGILRIRDDLQNRKDGVPQAVIDELNFLAEQAYGAAATEAGTTSSRYTLEMLKTEVNQFTEKFAMKYPSVKLDDNLRRILTEGLTSVIYEADRIKGNIDDLLRRQPIHDEDSDFTRIRRGIAGLSVISPELAQTLNALILDAQTQEQFDDQSLAFVRKNVEKWYDDAMDRVSGVFKRYSQTLALVIGIYLAVLLNVDAIGITNFLWREAFIRAALMESVSKFEIPQEEFVNNPKQAMQDFRRQFIGVSLLPIGWDLHKTDSLSLSDANCQLFPSEGQSFGVPIPYSKICITTPDSNEETNILLKLIGFLFTALAARMGAPLWFDVLRKLLRPT